MKRNMRRRIVTGLAGLLILFGGALSFAVPAAAIMCNGVEIEGTECPIETPGGGEGELIRLIKNVITVLTTVVGIIGVVVIIMAGVTYMTSLGDPGKVAKAKKMIMYAIVGIMISLLAYGIVGLILSAIGDK